MKKHISMKCHVLVVFQKLKDVAFPQAEVLKKALLRRFDEEYAQYLVRKVSWLTTHTHTHAQSLFHLH